jgi:hypothetical protein
LRCACYKKRIPDTRASQADTKKQLPEEVLPRKGNKAELVCPEVCCRCDKVMLVYPEKGSNLEESLAHYSKVYHKGLRAHRLALSEAPIHFSEEPFYLWR